MEGQEVVVVAHWPCCEYDVAYFLGIEIKHPDELLNLNVRVGLEREDEEFPFAAVLDSTHSVKD